MNFYVSGCNAGVTEQSGAVPMEKETNKAIDHDDGVMLKGQTRYEHIVLGLKTLKPPLASDGRHEDFQRMPTLDDGILCAKVDLRRENEAGSHDGGSNSAEPGAQAKTSELEAARIFNTCQTLMLKSYVREPIEADLRDGGLRFRNLMREGSKDHEGSPSGAKDECKVDFRDLVFSLACEKERGIMGQRKGVEESTTIEFKRVLGRLEEAVE
ncbi:hypothetical protein DEO72_LG3g2011 [Vigna unguiculata]|uniref:Uncharacterized protein n=1 Tax=Vigna unguiculata TaxID=3917 RepID=A0A4D6LGM5_VIGUN|nr:hypothetical protein DEO72_LG3g2011 [Vigna unguiculata]